MPDSPIKSAFAPMRPSVPPPKPPAKDATAAVRAPDATIRGSDPTEPSKPARESAKIIQADVAIELTLLKDATRRGLGVCYPRVTEAGTREIVISLNRACPLTARALAKADTALTKFIVGTLLVELALMRRGREIDAIATSLRTTVGLQNGRRDLLGFSYLANLLADSVLLGPVGSLPIYGPLGESNSGPYPIATLGGLELLEPSVLWRIRPLDRPPKEERLDAGRTIR